MVQLETVIVISGKPPDEFIKECKKAVLFHKPEKGYIYGKKKGKHITISFSKGFKKAQVFRNIWKDYPITIQRSGKKARF